MEEKQYLTVKEAADLLSMNPESLRRIAKEGKVSGSRKIGGKWLFDSKAIQDYIRWGSIR